MGSVSIRGRRGIMLITPRRKHEALSLMDAIDFAKVSLINYTANSSEMATCAKADKIWFVGRTEFMQEDYGRFRDMLQAEDLLSDNRTLPQRLPAEQSRPRDVYNGSTGLSNCSISNLRRSYQEDYAIIRVLAAHGSLPASYLVEIGAD